ncbi:MAG: hypothetical protein ABW046_01425 [Actinoplanes sp.]
MKPPKLALLVVAGVAALAGIAVASDPDQSQAEDIVRDVTIDPHDLVGSVQLAGGEQVKLYATDACASVVNSAGSTVSFCGGPADADLQLINGALVGYLPPEKAVTAKVTSGSNTSEAAVVHRYFILRPAAGAVGSQVVVTGMDADGKPVVTTKVTIT